jgi:hypothetical protein
MWPLRAVSSKLVVMVVYSASIKLFIINISSSSSSNSKSSVGIDLSCDKL